MAWIRYWLTWKKERIFLEANCVNLAVHNQTTLTCCNIPNSTILYKQTALQIKNWDEKTANISPIILCKFRHYREQQTISLSLSSVGMLAWLLLLLLLLLVRFFFPSTDALRMCYEIDGKCLGEQHNYSG